MMRTLRSSSSSRRPTPTRPDRGTLTPRVSTRRLSTFPRRIRTAARKLCTALRRKSSRKSPRLTLRVRRCWETSKRCYEEGVADKEARRPLPNKNRKEGCQSRQPRWKVSILYVCRLAHVQRDIFFRYRGLAYR